MSKNTNSTAICLVANFKYLYKNFPRIYMQLRNIGKYKGEILVKDPYGSEKNQIEQGSIR